MPEIDLKEIERLSLFFKNDKNIMHYVFRLKKYETYFSNPDVYQQITFDSLTSQPEEECKCHLLNYLIGILFNDETSKQEESEIINCLSFLIKTCKIDPNNEYLYTNGQPDPWSLLENACIYNNIKLLEIFFEIDPHLVKATNKKSRKNLLFFAQSKEITLLLMKTAKQTGFIQELLKPQNVIDESILGNLLYSEKFEIIMAIFEFENINEILNSEDVFGKLLICYLAKPEKTKEYRSLINIAKKYFVLPIYFEQKNNLPLLQSEPNFADFYSNYFNVAQVASECARDKNSALREIYIEIIILLNDRKRCIPHLKKIDQLVEAYSKDTSESPVPQLSTESYTFCSINGLKYPIPTDRYTPIKKNSVLQNALSLFFKELGFTGDFVKWFGTVPKDMGNESIMKLFIPLEGNYFSTLPHGKFSHAIQIFMLTSAILDGEIDTTYYEENGQAKKLTIPEIIKNIFSQEQLGAKEPLWPVLFDHITQFKDSFSDPYQVFSYIMCDPENSFPLLSSILKSSFCRLFIDIVELHNKIYKDNPINYDGLVTLLNEIPHNMFLYSSGMLEDSYTRSAKKTEKYQPYISEVSPETLSIAQKDGALLIRKYAPAPFPIQFFIKNHFKIGTQ